MAQARSHLPSQTLPLAILILETDNTWQYPELIVPKSQKNDIWCSIYWFLENIKRKENSQDLYNTVFI